MLIAAFSTATGAQSVRNATGVKPRVFPPSSMGEFKAEWLQGFDVLYFHLHGLAHQGYWYGDKWTTAMSDDQIRGCKLTGAVAFVANCYGLGSKMSQALLDAGCTAVVAGPETNYGKRGGAVRGADLLGQFFIGALTRANAVRYERTNPAEALRLAKTGLEIYLQKRGPIWRKLFSGPERDALEFQIQQREIT